MRQGSSTGSRTMVQRHGIARDLTVCGLFTALTAVGAFIKIVIPVGADTMNFTLQWFFVLWQAFCFAPGGPYSVCTPKC